MPTAHTPQNSAITLCSTLRALGLDDAELCALRSQGYVQRDVRAGGRHTYWRLRFRLAGRARTVYLADEQVAASVQRELEGLHAVKRRKRRLAGIVQLSRQALRQAKARVAPSLNQMRMHYHGETIRQIRSPPVISDAEAEIMIPPLIAELPASVKSMHDALEMASPTSCHGVLKMKEFQELDELDEPASASAGDADEAQSILTTQLEKIRLYRANEFYRNVALRSVVADLMEMEAHVSQAFRQAVQSSPLTIDDSESVREVVDMVARLSKQVAQLVPLESRSPFSAAGVVTPTRYR